MHGRVEVDDTMVMPTISPSCSLTYLRTNERRSTWYCSRGLYETRDGEVHGRSAQRTPSSGESIFYRRPHHLTKKSPSEKIMKARAQLFLPCRAGGDVYSGAEGAGQVQSMKYSSSTPPENRETHSTGRSTRSRSDGVARRHARACVPYGSRVPAGKSFG